MAERIVSFMCVKVSGYEDAIRAFLSARPIQVESTSREGDLIVLETFLPQSVIDLIDTKTLKVEVLYDATARGLERQKEVGKGNRFKEQQSLPQGLGVKSGRKPR